VPQALAQQECLRNVRKIEAEHVRQGVRYRQGEIRVYPDFSGGFHPANLEQRYCVVQGES